MNLRKLGFFFAFVLLPSVAFAHPGHNNGFLGGLIHPFTGVDHLLAMVAVGMLAAGVKEDRGIWFLPSSFVSALIVGGILGLAHVSFGLTETLIALSVAVLGALVALRVSLPLLAGMITVAVFGFFHGLAHGLEAGAHPVAFLVGMVISTAFLHFSGVALVKMAKGKKGDVFVRMVGSAMALVGVFLLV